MNDRGIRITGPAAATAGIAGAYPIIPDTVATPGQGDTGLVGVDDSTPAAQVFLQLIRSGTGTAVPTDSIGAVRITGRSVRPTGRGGFNIYRDRTFYNLRSAGCLDTIRIINSVLIGIGG